jgi:hypothetical protein
LKSIIVVSLAVSVVFDRVLLDNFVEEKEEKDKPIVEIISKT